MDRPSPLLDKITPILITQNEAANIGRTLAKLSWAKEVVVVDSFSDDETPLILEKFPNVRVFQRRFDCLANQFNYACGQTSSTAEWILSLDADYVLSEELLMELKALAPPSEISGYRCHFIYSIFGRPLRNSLYPSRVVLFRKQRAAYFQDGHTHRLRVKGKVGNLESKIVHDDRKPFLQWLSYQSHMARLEAGKLIHTPFRELDWPDRVRKTRVLAPLLVFLYCFLVKGLVWNGWPGFFYMFQRVVAELLVSIRLLELDFAPSVERR